MGINGYFLLNDFYCRYRRSFEKSMKIERKFVDLITK